ncbi:unnamed protein product [Cochlearia groenlandica]
MKSTVVIFVMCLLLAVPCFAIGSESEVYEIDYRGPETHNSIPPSETLHGKPPHIHHKISTAGSTGAHVGGESKIISTFINYSCIHLWHFG